MESKSLQQNKENRQQEFQFKIPEKVKNNHRDTAASVFRYLCKQWIDKDYNNDETKYISQKAIAEASGHSRHTVQRRLEDFDRVNLINIREGYNGPKGTKIGSGWLEKAEEFRNEFYNAKSYEKERDYLRKAYNRQGEETLEDTELGVQCCRKMGHFEQEKQQNPWHASARLHERGGNPQKNPNDSHLAARAEEVEGDPETDETPIAEAVSRKWKYWKLPGGQGTATDIRLYLRHVGDHRWSSGDQNPIMETLLVHIDENYSHKINSVEQRKTIVTAIGKLFKDEDLKLRHFEEVFELLDTLVEKVKKQISFADEISVIYPTVIGFLKSNLDVYEERKMKRWSANRVLDSPPSSPSSSRSTSSSGQSCQSGPKPEASESSDQSESKSEASDNSDSQANGSKAVENVKEGNEEKEDKEEKERKEGEEAGTEEGQNGSNTHGDYVGSSEGFEGESSRNIKDTSKGPSFDPEKRNETSFSLTKNGDSGLEPSGSTNSLATTCNFSAEGSTGMSCPVDQQYAQAITQYQTQANGVNFTWKFSTEPLVCHYGVGEPSGPPNTATGFDPLIGVPWGGSSISKSSKAVIAPHLLAPD